MIAKGSPPTLFVDLAPLAADGSNGGAAGFVLALLRKLAPAFDLHLLVKPAAAGAVAGIPAAVHLLGEDVREPRRLLRTLRRSPLAPFTPGTLRPLGARLLFSPLQTASFHEPGLPHVAIAYDFQELARPEFFAKPELRRRAAFRADLARCGRVVAISEFTRREGIAKAGLAPERVEVLPPVAELRAGVPDPAPLLARHGLAPGGYALYPANFWPHKNHARLLDALALVPEARLVCCGALGAPRAAERATFLPYLPDDELTALLQGARCLVFPSLFEGFGIPVLEAFALGVPVTCSRIPALEELAAGAALFFDPEDPRAIAEAFRTLWNDGARRAELAAAGRARGAAFDPESVVARYREMLIGIAATPS